MSQSDLNIANVSRSLFRQEANEALQALGSLSSGATEPTTTYAYQLWADTASGLLKQRTAANDGWINKGNLADVDWGFLNKAGGAMTGLLTTAKGADVASATTLPLIADGNYFDVTGTTTITAFASLGVGTWIGLHFDGILTLTHNATDLILPSGANITTAAGDEAIFVEYATGDWRCVSYTRASGEALVSSSASIIGDSKNLIITNNSGTPNSQVDIDADEIILKDSSGRAYLAEAVNLTVDITASGANGLDTGTEANSTWYYLWVIYNPTTDTVASLISLSATAPTLPTDYTYKALIGAIYNGSGGNFNLIRQVGNQVFISRTTISQSVPGTTYASISLATIVPPNAKSALIQRSDQIGASANVSLLTSPQDGDDFSYAVTAESGGGTAYRNNVVFELPLREVQTIYQKRNGTAPTTTAVYCTGWRY
jgi:hypothetical protein